MMDYSVVEALNPWWRGRSHIDGDSYVREALSRRYRITYRFNFERSTLLVGPRRVGKTTFFKLLIRDLLFEWDVDPRDVLYVSCEILRDHVELVDVVRYYRSRYVFLDEVTFLDGWEKAVKFILDHGVAEDSILMITGSSIAFLKRESFPGRNIDIVDFLPMDFRTYCIVYGGEDLREALLSDQAMDRLIAYQPEIFSLYIRYCESGGFPMASSQLAELGVIKSQVYDEIYSWYRGDILKLGRSEEIMSAVISKLLISETTPLSYLKIASYSGVSHRIVREYIETLRELFYLDYCRMLDPSTGMPAFRKEKKFYFTDPLITHTFEHKILGRRIIGMDRLAEQNLYATLRRHCKIYYQRWDGETDFTDGRTRWEVKWGEKPKPRRETLTLTRTQYNPEKDIAPLPVYLATLKDELWSKTLKTHGK